MTNAFGELVSVGPHVPTVFDSELDRESRRSGYVAVVDDDPAIRQMVCEYFEEHSLPAYSAANRHELGRYFFGSHPSLVVLDLKLGQDDGLDVLRDLRTHSDVPVIIITGLRCDDVDRVVGLELGADDYLAKPFNLRELLARVRAVLRRQEVGRLARVQNSDRGGYRFNGWQVERHARRLTDPDGNILSLTKGEYGLLIAFLEAPNRTLTREQLLQATRVHEDIFDRSIDVQVLRLRRKIETDPSAPDVIRTERGVGYLFTLPVEPF